MSRQIVFTSKAAKPPATYSQAVSMTVILADEVDFAGMNEECLRWPAKIPGLKALIAAVAEA